MGLIHNPALRTVVLGRGRLPFNTPLSISGLGMWFDGEVAYTSISPDVQALDTETIRRWPDLSGNGRHHDQAASGNKPLWSRTGINGRPALRGDGIDDYLSGTTGLGLLRNVSGATMFLVAMGNSGTVSASQLGGQINRNGGNQARATLQRASSNSYQAGGRRLDADSFASSTAGTTSTSAYIQAGRFNYSGAILRHYLNGTLIGTVNPFQSSGNTSDTDSEGMSVFGTNLGASPFPGLIAHYSVWPRLLTDAEFATMTTYLSQRYGVAV